MATHAMATHAMATHAMGGACIHLRPVEQRTQAPPADERRDDECEGEEYPEANHR